MEGSHEKKKRSVNNLKCFKPFSHSSPSQTLIKLHPVSRTVISWKKCESSKYNERNCSTLGTFFTRILDYIFTRFYNYFNAGIQLKVSTKDFITTVA